MIQLKKEQPAFKTDNYDYSLSGKQKHIRLLHPNQNILVLGNFDLETAEVSIDFPHNGVWYDYFGQDSLNIEQEGENTFTLGPGRFLLLSDEYIPLPMNALTVDPEPEVQNDNLLVYPNPGYESITFNRNYYGTEVHIFDMTGRSVWKGDWRKTISIESLSPGTYNIKIVDNNLKHHVRFVKPF
jgi:hypothetical protein